ncbi:MAG: hypothetical protein R2911_17220 [Caldilineaceae bacterium]
MQRNNYPFQIKFTLLVCLFIFILQTTLPAHAAHNRQGEPTNSSDTAGAYAIYLPLVYAGGGTTIKIWSGIHLGNMSRDGRYEWHPDQFTYVDPSRHPDTAIWPALIVVQSNQIYEIHRDDTVTGCPVTHATVRLPNAFEYIMRAAAAGSKIVIRITPSPGSFLSWNAVTPEDMNKKQMVVIDPLGVRKAWLLSEATNEYILTNVPPDFVEPPTCKVTHSDVEVEAHTLYRSLRDIGDEIKAIHDLNRAFGWAEYGFEPANEPNIEWFTENTQPNFTTIAPWDMMNFYFYYLQLYIDVLQNDFPDFQPTIFNPPMAQSQYETGVWMEYCNKDRNLKDQNGKEVEPRTTGYERMYDAIEVSDGFSWHNYWDSGFPYESYSDCDMASQMGGQHISYYFPEQLKTHLQTSGKPLIISEADLLSPHQLNRWRTPGIPNKGTRPEGAANSLAYFMEVEHDALQDAYPTSAIHFALWLLNDNTRSLEEAPNDERCNVDFGCNPDHNWHEAYNDDNAVKIVQQYTISQTTTYGIPGPDHLVNAVEERAWFAAWWLGAERVDLPPPCSDDPCQ